MHFVPIIAAMLMFGSVMSLARWAESRRIKGCEDRMRKEKDLDDRVRGHGCDETLVVKNLLGDMEVVALSERICYLTWCENGEPRCGCRCDKKCRKLPGCTTHHHHHHISKHHNPKGKHNGQSHRR